MSDSWRPAMDGPGSVYLSSHTASTSGLALSRPRCDPYEGIVTADDRSVTPRLFRRPYSQSG
jgi:hypothetical protein